MSPRERAAIEADVSARRPRWASEASPGVAASLGSTEAELALELDLLTVGHRRHRAVLSNLSLRWSPGRVIGVLGPNGSGKSTLLATLSGELSPLAGQVSLGSRPLAAYDRFELARLRAFVPQHAQASAPLSVVDRLALARGPAGRGGRAAADRAAIARAVGLTGLVPLLARRCDTLSGGELQRVRLACAIAQIDPPALTGSARDEPSQPGPVSRWLILDEPTAALDLTQTWKLAALWRRLAGLGVGIVAALHDLSLALASCDEVLLLGPDGLVAHGPPAEIIDAHALARAFEIDAEIHHLPGLGPVVYPRLRPTSTESPP